MVYGAILCGGDKRDRTADLLNAIQALSQLSYTPKYSFAYSVPSEQIILYSFASVLSTLFFWFRQFFSGVILNKLSVERTNKLC